MRKVRTRYAPSPTGPQHIGGLRTALYCYLFAHKHQGDFILRIEDTDQTRFVEGAEQYLIKALEWAGIMPNEGQGIGGPHAPYKQSQRSEIYKKYAQELLDKGHAYIAFDTDEELESWREKMKGQGIPSPQYNNVTRQYMKNSLSLSEDDVKRKLEEKTPYVIRFKTPRNEDIKFQDDIRGWITVNSNQIDDKVLMKSDGLPTYHLANVVDDYLMEISHVIRGEEWLPSAPLHILLYRAFGWDDIKPNFAHLPLILKPDGNGKLSKRDGDRLGFPSFPLNWKDPITGETSGGFKEKGFIPEAVINFLAFVGWNPGTDQEIFSKEELIEVFSMQRVSKAGARFDFEKAKWFNQQYLKKLSDEDILVLIQPIINEKGWNAEKEFLLKVIKLIRERAVFANEIPELSYYFFEEIREYDMVTIQKKWKAEKKNAFEELKQLIHNIESYNHNNIETVVKEFLVSNQIGMGEVVPILRIALCGNLQGPPIYEVMETMGKEKVVSRLEKGFLHFDQLKQNS